MFLFSTDEIRCLLLRCDLCSTLENNTEINSAHVSCHLFNSTFICVVRSHARTCAHCVPGCHCIVTNSTTTDGNEAVQLFQVGQHPQTVLSVGLCRIKQQWASTNLFRLSITSSFCLCMLLYAHTLFDAVSTLNTWFHFLFVWDKINLQNMAMSLLSSVLNFQTFQRRFVVNHRM